MWKGESSEGWEAPRRNWFEGDDDDKEAPAKVPKTLSALRTLQARMMNEYHSLVLSRLLLKLKRLVAVRQAYINIACGIGISCCPNTSVKDKSRGYGSQERKVDRHVLARRAP